MKEELYKLTKSFLNASRLYTYLMGLTAFAGLALQKETIAIWMLVIGNLTMALILTIFKNKVEKRRKQEKWDSGQN